MTTPAEVREICADLRTLHRQQPHETKHDLVRLALANWMAARVEVLLTSIDYMKGVHAQHPD